MNKTNLNKEQESAVTHSQGPLLIIAGAGTGKTRVITERISKLIESGIDPKKILAITFTNKAAGEMRSRVLKNLDTWKEESVPWIGTFHSFGVFFLRKNLKKGPLNTNFTIFDRGDSLSVLKKVMSKEGFEIKEHNPSKILNKISRIKNDPSKTEGDYNDIVVQIIFRKYNDFLKENNALDFDDLLIKTYEILRDNEDIRIQYQNMFQYIHIDEYQDTNKIQYEIIRILGKHRNICVVGDIDQAIYSWRGADIENIFNFERDFPDLTTITLEENYRSTKTILIAANEVITKNRLRKEKNLYTKNLDGENIEVDTYVSADQEADEIAKKIVSLIKSGVNKDEIAVLYRANFQSRLIEEACIKYDIPYHLIGTKFFERKEIKDMISFLRFVINTDSKVDLERIINFPPKGIGKVSLLKILNNDISSINAKTRVKVGNFFESIKMLSELIEKLPTSDVLKSIIKIFEIDIFLKNGDDDDLERFANIQELVTVAHKYDFEPPPAGVLNFIENVSLMSDQDSIENKNRVKLMTIHAAKGLEFDYVFIPGMEEGVFPIEKNDEDEDNEEERRLFYVALTRAKKQVFLSSAAIRTIYGSTQMQTRSFFINDISPEYKNESSNLPETSYLAW